MEALYFTATNKDTNKREVLTHEQWLDRTTNNLYCDFHPFSDFESAKCSADKFNLYCNSHATR